MPYRKPQYANRVKPPAGAVIDRSHPLAQGLSACWIMNEDAGHRIMDSYGRSHGDLTGSANKTPGRYNGKALKLSGSAQYVSVPNTNAIGADLVTSGQFTVTAMIKCDDFANYNGIFAKTNGAYPNPFDIYVVQTSATMSFYWGDGGTVPSTNFGNITTSTTLTAGIWTLVTFVYTSKAATSGQNRAYINGVKCAIGTTNDMSNNLADGGGAARIGSRGDGVTMMKGSIDFVYLHKRALTDEEIQQTVTNPYCFFKAPSRRIISQVSAAAAASTAEMLLMF